MVQSPFFHRFSRVFPCALALASSFFSSAKANEVTKAPIPRWNLETSYVGSSKADIDEEGRDGQSLSFSQAEAEASYTHVLDPQDSVSVNLAYTQNSLDWDENPFFTEKDFSYVQLQLRGMTMRVAGWRWVAALGTQFDPEEMDLAKYAMHRGLLWGRYHLSNLVGIHVGITGSVGLRKDTVYPVLGFDYRPNHNWTINVIFPLNLSANYAINENWSVAASARTFRARHRLSQKATVSRGIFDYRTFGSELSLNYTIGSFLAKAHLGTTYAGDLKVSDSQGKNPVFTKYKGAMYLGSKLTYKF